MVTADTDHSFSTLLEEASRIIQRISVLSELDVTDPFLSVPASGKENALSTPDIVARSPDNGTSICILDSAGKTKNATT